MQNVLRTNKDTNDFFGWFEQAANNNLAAARLLDELCRQYENPQQMVEHIHARNAAQQFKAELITQKAAHGNKMASIHVQVQQILSHYLDCKFTTGDLHQRGEIPDKRGLLISIAPGFV